VAGPRKIVLKKINGKLRKSLKEILKKRNSLRSIWGMPELVMTQGAGDLAGGGGF